MLISAGFADGHFTPASGTRQRHVDHRAPWRRGGGPATPGRLPRKTCAAHLRGALLRSSPLLRALVRCCVRRTQPAVKDLVGVRPKTIETARYPKRHEASAQQPRALRRACMGTAA